MNRPVLAKGSTWYKSTENQCTITKIVIRKNYVPNSYDETWVASADDAEEIVAYRRGTEITLTWTCGDKIFANEESHHLFCYDALTAELINVKTFSNLESIEGLDNIDTSNAKNMNSAFAYCTKLTSLDLSSWDVSNVETFFFMFASNHIYIPDGSQLAYIDLTGWNTSSYCVLPCPSL